MPNNYHVTFKLEAGTNPKKKSGHDRMMFFGGGWGWGSYIVFLDTQYAYTRVVLWGWENCDTCISISI